MAETAPRSDQATIQGKSNLKFSKHGEILEGLNCNDSSVEEGHHAFHVGLNRLPIQPATGYQPTPGLVWLFTKTGTSR
jgi:hypothetical protein